jgi:hypothetical protein
MNNALQNEVFSFGNSTMTFASQSSCHIEHEATATPASSTGYYVVQQDCLKTLHRSLACNCLLIMI